MAKGKYRHCRNCYVILHIARRKKWFGTIAFPIFLLEPLLQGAGQVVRSIIIIIPLVRESCKGGRAGPFLPPQLRWREEIQVTPMTCHLLVWGRKVTRVVYVSRRSYAIQFSIVRKIVESPCALLPVRPRRPCFAKRKRKGPRRSRHDHLRQVLHAHDTSRRFIQATCIGVHEYA